MTVDLENLVEKNRLLNAKEASRFLSISPRKLWELTSRGEIRCVRLDRAVRYSPGDLGAFIESKTSQGPSRSPVI